MSQTEQAKTDLEELESIISGFRDNEKVGYYSGNLFSISDRYGFRYKTIKGTRVHWCLKPKGGKADIIVDSWSSNFTVAQVKLIIAAIKARFKDVGEQPTEVAVTEVAPAEQRAAPQKVSAGNPYKIDDPKTYYDWLSVLIGSGVNYSISSEILWFWSNDPAADGYILRINPGQIDWKATADVDLVAAIREAVQRLDSDMYSSKPAVKAGSLVANARRSKGISPSDFADAIDVDIRDLWLLESGYTEQQGWPDHVKAGILKVLSPMDAGFESSINELLGIASESETWLERVSRSAVIGAYGADEEIVNWLHIKRELRSMIWPDKIPIGGLIDLVREAHRLGKSRFPEVNILAIIFSEKSKGANLSYDLKSKNRGLNAADIADVVVALRPDLNREKLVALIEKSIDMYTEIRSKVRPSHKGSKLLNAESDDQLRGMWEEWRKLKLELREITIGERKLDYNLYSELHRNGATKIWNGSHFTQLLNPDSINFRSLIVDRDGTRVRSVADALCKMYPEADKARVHELLRQIFNMAVALREAGTRVKIEATAR